MKGAFILGVLTLLLSQLSLGYGGDSSDSVDVKARQYNCPYYYMMMNSGSPVVGLSPWLLLCLAAAALAVSSNCFSRNSQRL